MNRPETSHSDDGDPAAASLSLLASGSQALLLGLIRAQREAEDPNAIMSHAARVLGHHLRANRVGFFEMADDDTLVFSVGWADGVLPVLAGSFPASGLGAAYLAEVRAGRTVGIGDMQHDPLTRDSCFAGIGVRSGIGAPILRGGRWRAGLYVNHVTEREWTEDEVALVREAADQSWDAVERVRAMLALRASEARSRAILNATSDAIAVSDRAGTVLAANPAYLELYGYDAAEVIGHSFAIIFPEAHRVWAEEEYRAAFDKPDAPQVNEARVRRKDGAERIVEVRAGFVVENEQRTALVSAIRDVTERHAAEAALRASEERLRLALDAAGMGVYAWDPATDRTDADATLLALLGIRPDEALSLATALDTHIHPADRARYGAAVAGMLDPDGAGRLEEEVRWRDADGERWLSFTGQAFFDGDGTERRAVRAIGTVMDVTHRKRAELERQTFAASAAHDLRTPLTTIMGQAQLLVRRTRRGTSEPARLETGLVEINTAALRMLALIDEIMDAARLDAGQALELQLAPTDLVVLVERIAEELRSTTTRHRLRVVRERQSLIGQWDSARLGRVVGNLLANAIKYSPDGGEIVVRVRSDDTGGTARAVLSVTDCGVGIPAHDLPGIFERFSRGINVTGRIGGTGIGLAGASRIVGQHGGTMQVESREGQGSTFTVILPLSLDAEPNPGA